MNFESWLAAKGWDDSSLSDVQRASLLAAWKAEITPPHDPATAPRPQDRLAQIHADIAAEEKRQADITDLVAAAVRENPRINDEANKIGKLAIDAKWDTQRTDLELLRLRRPIVAHVLSRPDPEVTDRAIEAAVCVAGGLGGLEKHFDERTLEAAARRWRHGLHLGDLIMTYARRGGYDGHSLKANLPSALRAAFAPDVRAAGSWGPSTGGGLSGVLSNVANKFLKAGFDAVDTTWRRISAIRSVNDFKAITSYSLTGGLTYDKVAPGGEIRHGQLGAESYTNQVDTYGKMIGIDRRDLINDDLGALTQVGRRLGRGAALKINDVFWTVFLNNSAFFTSGRANVSTGAGSALGTAGLDAANGKFLAQTDPDGNPAGFTPAILLAPPALWSTGAALMQSMGLTVGSGTAVAPSSNIWANKFRLESSPYMSNANYTGYSAAAWYLLSDPADAAVIEVAFLNGNESPTVESADADFGQLGIAMRGYHDFGCSLQEYRAGVRSAGS